MIDYFHCKPLRCSLQPAKIKKRINRNRSIVAKEKTSEKLPIHRLPLESTNASDSFKYLMMRKA
jgi:hypothetical protein